MVAVDPDGERVAFAREKYSADNNEFIQADDKTFPPNQYDIVFCNATIHWIKDKEELFKYKSSPRRSICVYNSFIDSTNWKESL